MQSLLEPPLPNLITSLPVNNHSVLVKAAEPKNNWKAKFHNAGQDQLWHTIFGNNDSIRISRYRLLNHVFATPEQKIAEILLWGYPGDMRGIVSRLLTNLSFLTTAASTVADWRDYFEGYKTVRGINISTITKLAYFHGSSFNNQPALILDSRLIESTALWKETSVSGMIYNNAPRHYITYLNSMHSAAKQISEVSRHPCRADQLEFFLFALGNSF